MSDVVCFVEMTAQILRDMRPTFPQTVRLLHGEEVLVSLFSQFDIFDRFVSAFEIGVWEGVSKETHPTRPHGNDHHIFGKPGTVFAGEDRNH